MNITVLGGEKCRFCTLAKNLLDTKGLTYEYKDVRKDEDAMGTLSANGFKTIPQVWADGKHIGGYTELYSFLQDQS